MGETGDQSLTDDAVRKVAKLSRLALDDAQIHEAAKSLADVLGYIQRLHELNLEGVEPMAHPQDACNRFGADEPTPGMSTETLMRMAPAVTPPFLKVPKVLGGGDGA